MSVIDGHIFFALLIAALLAWVAGSVVANKYAEIVLALMNSGLAPVEQSASSEIAMATAEVRGSRQIETFDLARQNRSARWLLYLAFTFISVVLAGFIAYVAQAIYVEDGFSWRRFILLTWVYAWPAVPSIGLLERWPRWKIVILSLAYMSLAGLLVRLNSGEQQDWSNFSFWLFGQQVPLLVFVFFMTGAKLRAVAPYLLTVFFLLTMASLLSLNGLAMLIEDEADWLIDWVSSTNAYVVFILFIIAPWLIAIYPVRWLAGRVAQAYQSKYFSEPLYLITGLWTIALIFQAMVLSHQVGLAAYGILSVWAVIPIGILLMNVSLRPRHQPPSLLLLRVFRSDDEIGVLFDSVLERWRYSGNTLMIAGSDLALRTLEPDELFAFLNGRLQDRFINSGEQLNETIRDPDLQADPDGRYRINEFYCFDHTWKTVLAALVEQSACVLMDLRGYTPNRQGCTHELTVLSAQVHLHKIVLLFDGKTDKQAADRLLSDCATKIVWIDSEVHGKKLEGEVLTTLLS